MLVLSYNCVKFPESDNAVVVLECVRALSRVWLFTTTWNSGQGHWSGLPFPAPRDLPDLGIEPVTPVLARGYLTTEQPGKPFFPLVLLV